MLESDINSNIASDNSATHGSALPETPSNEDDSNILESEHEHNHDHDHHLHHEEDHQLSEGRISMQRRTVNTLKCLAVLMMLFIPASVIKAIPINESYERIPVITQAEIGLVGTVGISDVVSKIIIVDRATIIRDIYSAEIKPISCSINNQIKVVDIKAIGQSGIAPIDIASFIAVQERKPNTLITADLDSTIAA